MPTTTEPAAVLLVVDTCSLLDVLRAPHRKGLRGHLVRDAKAVLEHAAAQPGELTIAICDVTASEFEANVAKVSTETKTALQELLTRIVQANEASIAFDLQAAHLPELQVLPDVLTQRSEDLARDLIASAEKVVHTEDDRRAGFSRVTERLAPARQGSSATADSVIVECALRVARSRRPAATWFMSSNTKDFCENRRLHPDLGPAFEEAGAEYVKSWGEVVGRLRLNA